MNNNHPEKIIIHHSYSIDNLNSNNYIGICNYHQSLGWRPPCGYHRIYEYINEELIKHKGRKENENGAHTKENEMNFKSIGICIIGNFDINIPTSELYKELANDIFDIMKRYPHIKIDDIEPHSKYAPYKTCPGKKFNMDYLKKLIFKKIYSNIRKDVRLNQTYSLPNGEEIVLEGNMYNGHFETPIRAILEKLGYEIIWTKEKTFIK